MSDNRYELFPIVDDGGQFLGTISRGHAHDGTKILHPVVHLHVFNSRGDLYLQKRPEWKDIQPGKWDTACGGHVDLGERIADALQREVAEELGIRHFTPTFVTRYVFESQRERELVHVHTCIYDGPITPSATELSYGRFWSQDEIAAHLGKDTFTPNFESEYTHYILPAMGK